MIRFALLLLAIAGPAAAQAPASEPAAAQPREHPAPPLKLRLDEAEPKPRITFGPPKADTKQSAPDNLPTLGGNPSPALERTPSQVVPKDPTPGF